MYISIQLVNLRTFYHKTCKLLETLFDPLFRLGMSNAAGCSDLAPLILVAYLTATVMTAATTIPITVTMSVMIAMTRPIRPVYSSMRVNQVPTPDAVA